MAGESPKSRQSIPILCKIVELCLTIVIVGLIVDPTNNGILSFDQNHSGIVYVAWPGYIVINAVLIIGHIIGDRIPKRTLMLFSFVGAILYIAASGVVIHDWRQNQTDPTRHPSKQYQDMAIAAAVIGLFTAILMFLETAALALIFDDDEED